jgi:hypothetical protein
MNKEEQVIEIKSVKVKLGDIEVDLTPEQLRCLYDAIGKLLSIEPTKYFVYNNDWYDPLRPYKPDSPQITWSIPSVNII